MSGRRLSIGENMRAMLNYPKFSGTTRMLVLETEYFFDQSWVRAASTLGWQCAAVSSAMTGGLTRDQVADLFRTVAEFKPDFIITSNYAGMDMHGLFAGFFEDAKIPYVSWFTDTPRMILFNRTVYTSNYSVAAVWERGYMPHLRSLGFEHVYFMPHATDPALFSGEPIENHIRQLAFVGDSMISHAEEAWEKLREFPDIEKAVRAAFSENRMSRSEFAHGVERIIDPIILDACEPRERRHLELCLVYEGTRRIREAMVRRLAPFGIEVHGDKHWNAVHSNTHGDIGYFDKLAAFYRETAVNINSTSVQMATALNQRVFDCPAAGGFLITDAQADLEEFFELGTETATYSSLDELQYLVVRYREDAQARRRIVESARKRILSQHTHAHRLKDLETYLKARFA
ncbi:MAG TPA: glycosyltransferase [Candidatus Hydrogenedentes bacterium]|nr:glycosyltransferase [Candidatus Hydrogenedentota bacterium]HRK36365.1 glycosyltransferase [Candidatus Hydrogenedentota bacterium]